MHSSDEKRAKFTRLAKIRRRHQRMQRPVPHMEPLTDEELTEADRIADAVLP